MALVLNDVEFIGPAMPAPFVLHKLEPLLTRKKLLAHPKSAAKAELEEQWEAYYRKLRAMREQGLDRRVLHHVIEPLVMRLAYERLVESEPVSTREGLESGGFLLSGPPGTPHLRAWAVSAGTDLDAPNKRGRAYRFSPALIAQRVLLTKGERIGLLTDGLELRIVLSDPSGRDSHLAIDLRKSGGWRNSRKPPDSYRLLRALCQPAGVEVVGELLDEARLAQTGVTKKLRQQARSAVEGFIQGLLDDPQNHEAHGQWKDLDAISKELWHEGLIFVYRLLFVLKLESASDPARSFSFATVSTWRNSYSPSTALAPIAEKVRDEGAETGGFLQHSLRALFRVFSEGLSSSDLQVSPLGGMLFGQESTPLLDSLAWSEKAVATLLDALLWTTSEGSGKDATGRERVHYGALDVEDLGRVYEALLELEPGVTREPMCQLRRAKLEVVVPLKDGAPYRKNKSPGENDEDDEEGGDGAGGKKTKVVFVEEIPKDRFFLRVGLGRKASGSYYTPHPFVRFLVQETLGPQVAQRSPRQDPNPAAILALNVLDPAMGSGHFLVEACRFLGEALYEACRLCDERALEAQRKSETTKKAESRAEFLERARVLWKRVEDLPDPDNELLAYLPSRILDGDESGLSQRRALALCRRLVAVHSLYGVDKNPLAVELARVSLWLESYAEGLPLTFLEHRLICGDSLTGPFFEHLLTFPGTGKPVEQLHSQGVGQRLRSVLTDALSHVRELEASVGKDIADLELKRIAKHKLDRALEPLILLSAAWSGAALTRGTSDDAYKDLVALIVSGERLDTIANMPSLQLIEKGRGSVPFDLVFPEIFHPDGVVARTGGFDAVLGNPPWKKLNLEEPGFMGAFDVRAFDVDHFDREQLRNELETTPAWEKWLHASEAESQYVETIVRLCADTFDFSGGAFGGGDVDIAGAFLSKCWSWVSSNGAVGLVVPSAIHASKTLTPLRVRLLQSCEIVSYFCFENRGGRVFPEVHNSWKFTPLVIRDLGRPPTGDGFDAQFYLNRLDWLSSENKSPAPLRLSRQVLSRLDPTAFVFQEFTDPLDAAICAVAYAHAPTFAEVDAAEHVNLRRELDATDDAWRLDHSLHPRRSSETKGRGLIHHKPGTIHQYTDEWEGADTALVPLDRLVPDKLSVVELSRYYRLAYRVQARATDERTAIFCLLPWGTTATNKVRIEGSPQARPTAVALSLLAVANSYVYDWLLRLRTAGLTISKYVVNATPVLRSASPILVHGALRLSCNHADFRDLWYEQVGDEWRERTAPREWPVLRDQDARWFVRAAIDAVVADGYGIERGHYERVLGSFSHSSYPKAPDLCLRAFDELRLIGLETFVRKHDPYWDVPLVTRLPKPTLEVAGGAVAAISETFSLSASAAKPSRQARSKRS